MSLKDLPHDQFTELAERTRQQYQELKARNLNLDLTRGKPSSEQLDFSNALLSLPGEGDYKDKTGADVRNYGNLQGIADIRELWAEALGIDPANLIAGDSSSLNIMFDLISFAHLGHQRFAAPLEGRGDRQVALPGTGLRPPLRHHRALRL